MPKVNPKKQLNEVPKNQEVVPKNKRRSLTAAQKKEICLKKISTPSLKQIDLSKEYNVSEGMISDILKARDRWLAIDDNSHQASLK
ncbi:5393_t:CDS:1, partial [Rhizophagus irregularis]